MIFLSIFESSEIIYENMPETEAISYSKFVKNVLEDFYLSHLSRQLSILGSKEVSTSNNKFGILGDGKEIAQVALAKYFRDGDWHSGNCHDQSFMFASGMSNPAEFFSMLYGSADLEQNTFNGVRNFNNHFGTRYINQDGTWKPQVKIKNSSSVVSSSTGQLHHLLGLAYASKLYRQLPKKKEFQSFTNNGNEIAIGNIDVESLSELHFHEILNAASTLQVPLALIIWDYNNKISYPNEIQTAEKSITKILKEFSKDNTSNGIVIYKAKGWDYPNLCKTFALGLDRCRTDHVPVIFQITELSQPIEHSISGNHNQYKSAEHVEWEQQHYPLKMMRQWILEKQIATKAELDLLEQKAIKEIQIAQNNSLKAHTDQIIEEKKGLLGLIQNKNCQCKHDHIDKLAIITENLKNIEFPLRKELISSARKILRVMCNDCPTRKKLQLDLIQWIEKQQINNIFRYSSNLYCETAQSALNVLPISPVFDDKSLAVYGHEIIRDNFDSLLQQYPNLIVLGENIGKIGGVNKTYEGLQKKYGKLRIINEGICEKTIIGQGIGLTTRGFKAIAEIENFNHLLSLLQPLNNDLATLRWRTNGGQAAPLIISTRVQKIEGIQNPGLPLSEIINSIRGIHVCVPRNMTQTAGFYNTLLKGQDPALVVEPVTGYHLKERKPENIGEYCIPLGIPEILYEGDDVTLVTYGQSVKIAADAVEQLTEHNISVELIDVQTILPFDLNNTILKSISKTHKVIFFDEDIPGGVTAFMMQKVIEEQGCWQLLETAPKTITAMEHPTVQTIDGNYYSNPTVEDVFETIYKMMSEINPDKFPKIL